MRQRAVLWASLRTPPQCLWYLLRRVGLLQHPFHRCPRWRILLRPPLRAQRRQQGLLARPWVVVSARQPMSVEAAASRCLAPPRQLTCGRLRPQWATKAVPLSSAR